MYGRHGPNGYSSGWLEKLHVSINKFINTTYLQHPSAHLPDSFYGRPWGMKKKFLHFGYQLLWHYSYNASPGKYNLESILWECPIFQPIKAVTCFVSRLASSCGAPCHLYQSCIWNLLSLCSHGALHPSPSGGARTLWRLIVPTKDPVLPMWSAYKWI